MSLSENPFASLSKIFWASGAIISLFKADVEGIPPKSWATSHSLLPACTLIAPGDILRHCRLPLDLKDAVSDSKLYSDVFSGSANCHFLSIRLSPCEGSPAFSATNFSKRLPILPIVLSILARAFWISGSCLSF